MEVSGALTTCLCCSAEILILLSLRGIDDYQAIFAQLGQTMQLLQGFLLLHASSRRLFSIPCNMEVCKLFHIMLSLS
jgi:hypothetical protein